MRLNPDYIYCLESYEEQICDFFCLKCYDENCWKKCISSAFPIDGFKSVDFLFYTPLKPKEPIRSSIQDQEGFKVQKEKENLFVCYLRLWYYVWYNIFRGIRSICIFVKDIF